MSFQYKGRTWSIEDFYNGLVIGEEKRPLTGNDVGSMAAISDHQQKQVYGCDYVVAFKDARAGELAALEQARKEAEERLTDDDRRPWCVINILPFPLNVDGVVHSQLRGPDGNQVAACKVGERFSHRHFDDVVWSLKDNGAGPDNIARYEPIPHTPESLAKEYENINLAGRILGPLVFSCGNRAFLDSPRGKVKLGAMQWARNKWFLDIFEFGEQCVRNNRSHFISDIWKKAAEVLLFDKVIDELPQWATK